MYRPLICLAILTSCVTLVADKCDAQLRQRIRDRRAALLTPPADSNAPAAAPAPAADAAVPPVPPIRGGFLARRLQMRRDLVAQQAALAQPTPASPASKQPAGPQQTQRTAARRPLTDLRQASARVAPVLRTLSEVELSQMDVPQLQTVLSNTNGTLGNELRQFTSAASWQEFLRMPPGIVDEGTIDLAALQTLLVRFEKVAANPEYSQVASLPSFQQSRTLLAELVNRTDPPTSGAAALGAGPQLIDPASAAQLAADQAESLPAPEPRPEPQLPRNEGEHSILVRDKNG